MATNNSRFYSILAYITPLGWLLSFLFRNREDEIVRQHLNQALFITIANLIFIALARVGGGLVRTTGVLGFLFMGIFIITGLFRASQADATPLPIFGDIKVL